MKEPNKPKKTIFRIKRTSKAPMFVGKIIDVVNEVSTSQMAITQGVNDSKVREYEKRGYTVRNGNAWIGHPETTRRLYLVISNNISKKKTWIEVRQKALEGNGRSNVTDKFVEQLKKNLVGKEVKYLTTQYEDYLDDYSILKM